jgi:hypothetical protein
MEIIITAIDKKIIILIILRKCEPYPVKKGR